MLGSELVTLISQSLQPSLEEDFFLVPTVYKPKVTHKMDSKSILQILSPLIPCSIHSCTPTSPVRLPRGWVCTQHCKIPERWANIQNLPSALKNLTNQLGDTSTHIHSHAHTHYTHIEGDLSDLRSIFFCNVLTFINISYLFKFFV